MKNNNLNAVYNRMKSQEEVKLSSQKIELSAMDDLDKATSELEEGRKGMYDFFGNVKKAEQSVVTLMKQVQGYQFALERNYDTFKSARTLVEESARELGIEVSDLPQSYKKAIGIGDDIDRLINMFQKSRDHMLTAYKAIQKVEA